MKIFQNNLLAKFCIISALVLGSTPAFSQVSVSINIAPPPLQVYAQPACPDDGYIWTPGYWAYGDSAYYWVPGAWVQPPQIGYLWTPPYWGWSGNTYVFYPGYWGESVGYYGGINYGYGYGGNGYGGGRWQGGHFSYNTAVNNVSSTIVHNTYVDRSVVNNHTSKVSYNGGAGGVLAKPTAQEKPFSTEQQSQPTTVQPPEPTVHSQAPIQQRPEPQLAPAQDRPQGNQNQQDQVKPQTKQYPNQQQQAQTKQQAQPKQQAQKPTPDKTSAAQPDNKPNNAPNNTPGH
ncbi:MAG: hypothetical protein LV481_04350 [Methylacidiphilales bacterium]|nr:hypothetical protein [Candidatus Methylacidiphilales bacterium]